MKTKFILFLIVTFSLFSCKEKYKNLPDGLYAEIKTNKGVIITQLEYEKTPVTVANFVSLAEGKNSFVTDSFKGKPFYNGLTFHRVIPDFMIQGGDPNGDGSGDAGYKFKDECTSDLKFDKGGLLAMANAGPGTNGSQFFITHVATEWLTGKHTIFGHVVENGMQIVNKIESDDKIISIKIIRKGPNAKKFDAPAIFSNYFAKESENQKKILEQSAAEQKINEAKSKVVQERKLTELNAYKASATKLPSGLQFKLIKKGSGKKPTNGMNVFVNYAGYLENGLLFDTCIESIAKDFGKFDQRRADAHQYIPIPCSAGSYQFIPGFNEGLGKMNIGDKVILYIPTHLAYGETGAGNVVPPNANIIFEVELLDKIPTN